jgi:penicillin-binding protein 1C
MRSAASARFAGLPTANRCAGPPRRPVYWQPDGVGFARLTAIDADGRSARNTVRLSP